MKDANCVSLVAFMPKIDHHSKLAPIDNQGLDLIYDNKSYVFAVLDQSAVVETNQGLRFK